MSVPVRELPVVVEEGTRENNAPLLIETPNDYDHAPISTLGLPQSPAEAAASTPRRLRHSLAGSSSSTSSDDDNDNDSGNQKSSSSIANHTKPQSNPYGSGSGAGLGGTSVSGGSASDVGRDDVRPTSWLHLSRQYISGIILLVGVIFIWVGSSVLIQYIFENEEFDKPFFLTYLSTSLFSTYLIGFFFMPHWKVGQASIRDRVVFHWKLRKAKKHNTGYIENSSIDKDDPNLSYSTFGAGASASAGRRDSGGDASTAGAVDIHDVDTGLVTSGTGDDPVAQDMLTTKETMRLSLLFCPFWFVANYAFNLSLGMTSVSSNTILSTTSGLWTFTLSLVFLQDPFNWIKLGAVITSLGGVAIIALADSSSGSSTLVGDLIALFSALAYAVYTILLKVKIPEESRVSMPMFFGFVGLFNVLLLWPIIIMLDVTGWETYVNPSPKVFGFLVVNGLIGTVLSDYLWAKSVLLTSPVVSTVGLSLTFPLAVLADSLMGDKTFGIRYIMGSLLVACGFITTTLADHIPFCDRDVRLRKRSRDSHRDRGASETSRLTP